MHKEELLYLECESGHTFAIRSDEEIDIGELTCPICEEYVVSEMSRTVLVATGYKDLLVINGVLEQKAGGEKQVSERLTARSPKNDMPYLVNVRENEQAVDGSYNTLMCIRDSWEKLAKYEETGLSPDDIEKLKIASRKVREILGDMRNMPDGSTYSIALIREMFESLL